MDTTLQSLLVEKIDREIEGLYPMWQGGSAEVTQSMQSSFGHYQCNSCLKMAKVLGVNPRVVANQLKESLEKNPSLEGFFSKLEVAGPGFLNITFSSSFLEKKVNDVQPEKTNN